METIKWLNPKGLGKNGMFISARGQLEADGRQRINFYFSAYAAQKLGLKAGEKLLVGINSEQQRLAIRVSPNGANRLSKKGPNGALTLSMSIAKQLPHPKVLRIQESDVSIKHGMFTFPYPVDGLH